MQVNQIVQGDALTILRTLPDKSVQCVVTSPPYFGLRDYNVEGQIGLEETPQEYISKLVAVFMEVWRVLRDDGLLWVNIGDSYANDGKWGGSTSGKHVEALHGQDDSRARRYTGLKPKNLMMIPARLAIALQDQGWILRSEIVWSKVNAMPESVQDRPTKAHEMVYMLAKSERYYYDAQAIREEGKEHAGQAGTFARHNGKMITLEVPGQSYASHRPDRTDRVPAGRNARSVWPIATQPYKEAHFACMPPKLAERCILASTRPGDVVLDPFSGAGTTALVANNLNRRYIGIELNPDYVSMSRRRLVQPSLDFEWTA